MTSVYFLVAVFVLLAVGLLVRWLDDRHARREADAARAAAYLRQQAAWRQEHDQARRWKS